MMLLANEMNGIAEFIATKFPEAAVYRYQEPTTPELGAFVIQLKRESRRVELNHHSLIERQYGIIFYGANIEQALITMEALCRSVMNERIAITGTTKALRVDSFTFESTVKTSNGLAMCSGTMLTQVRETITKEDSEKMRSIALRLHTN
jgi:hypothetical protein